MNRTRWIVLVVFGVSILSLVPVSAGPAAEQTPLRGMRLGTLPLPENGYLEFTSGQIPLYRSLPVDVQDLAGFDITQSHDDQYINDWIDSWADVETFCSAYRRFHPMFAQAVVHDDYGNLLFFIIDNCIYNRNGRSFNPDGTPTYLHSGEIDGCQCEDDDGGESCPSTWKDMNGSEINRRNAGRILLPGLIVIPLPAKYQEFLVIYALRKQMSSCGLDLHASFFCRRLKVKGGKSQSVILSAPQYLGCRLPFMPIACGQRNQVNTSVTRFRSDVQNYLLFLHFDNYIAVYEVSASGTITFRVRHEVPIPLGSNHTHFFGSPLAEMEVAQVVDQNTDFYYLAYPISGVHPYYALLKLDYHGNLVNQLYVDLPGYGMPTGLEFSQDGRFLYFTFRGQPNLYYLDLTVAGSADPILKHLTVAAPERFEDSTIEAGGDGKLYLVGRNTDGWTGTLHRLTRPNQPSLSQLEQVPGTRILYPAHTFESSIHWPSGLFPFTNQVDGAALAKAITFTATREGSLCRVTAAVHAGTAPYAYYWNDGPTAGPNDILVTPGSSYSLKVVDAEGLVFFRRGSSACESYSLPSKR